MSNGLLIILDDSYSHLPDHEFKEINDKLDKMNCEINLQTVSEYIHNINSQYYSRNGLFNICIMNKYEDQIISNCDVNPYAESIKVSYTFRSSLYSIIEEQKVIIEDYKGEDVYNKLMTVLSDYKIYTNYIDGIDELIQYYIDDSIRDYIDELTFDELENERPDLIKEINDYLIKNNEEEEYSSSDDDFYTSHNDIQTIVNFLKSSPVINALDENNVQIPDHVCYIVNKY